MAINLPYPDMDFVPLDILTANELDQMVANIEYIANSFPIGSTEIASNAITTAKINNGAVTSDKIDFTTFGSSVVPYTAKGSTTLTAWTYADITNNFTISDLVVGGKYLMLCNSGMAKSDYQTFDCYARVQAISGTSNMTSNVAGVGGYNYRFEFGFFTVFTATATSATFKIQGEAGANGTYTFINGNATTIRIG